MQMCLHLPRPPANQQGNREVPDLPPNTVGAWLTHSYSSEGQEGAAQGQQRQGAPALRRPSARRTQKQWAPPSWPQPRVGSSSLLPSCRVNRGTGRGRASSPSR